MANEELLAKLGFDPKTDTDALNEYFLKLLEAIADDETLTLTDFKLGMDSPALKAKFNEHIEKDMLDHMNFTLFCITSLITTAATVTEMFEASRQMLNVIAIESLSTVMQDTVRQLTGSDAMIQNLLSQYMGEFTSKAISGAVSDTDMKDDFNLNFKIRYSSTTFALERAAEDDYEYVLDEASGFFKCWKTVSFDKTRDVYESPDFRDGEKYVGVPAAITYPSQELLDRCVIAMSRIAPRFYCGINNFFNLHSDPYTALQAYLDAREERPSTAPAFPDWTPDIVRSRSGSNLRGSVSRKYFDPTDPYSTASKPTTVQGNNNATQNTPAAPQQPDFDLGKTLKNMNDEQKKNFFISILCAVLPSLLAIITVVVPSLSTVVSILGLVGLILSAYFAVKAIENIGWSIGLAILFRIGGTILQYILLGILF